MLRAVIISICFGLWTGLAPLISVASAQSLSDALSLAYSTSPDLEAARAGLRASDENVAIAKSGKRPSLSLSATAQAENVEGVQTNSASVSLSAGQALFDGYRTKNNVLAAQARIMAGRQSLLSTEMDVLIITIQAYIDVLLNQQITSIRNQNLDFLEEQLRASNARLEAGEGTRTDVSQSQASLAAAKAQLAAAEADLKAARANFVQAVGQAPKRLTVPDVPQNLLPANLNAAIGVGLSSHPALMSARYNIDAAQFDVGVQKSALLPGVYLSGSLSETDGGTTSASIGARLTVPIFSGGANYANVRRSKQVLGQAQLQRDSIRLTVEQLIIDSWVNLQSSEASIKANKAQVGAAQLALSGVVEEQKVGQRTTLDVLNAQANVLNARESLAVSQRNLLISAYNILYTTGQLTADKLRLKVKKYRPEDHYEAVEDKWFGLRTVTNK